MVNAAQFREKRMKFVYAAVVIFTLCPALSQAAASAEAKANIITIATPSWDAGKLIAYNIGTKIEKETTFKVNYLPMEGEKIWGELNRPDGVIDIFPDIWTPNQQTFWDE